MPTRAIPSFASSNVGRVVLGLRGNDVPAKHSRFSRGNVIDEEVPKVWLGNSVKIDAVQAIGNPRRFGAPVIKRHGGGSGDSSSSAARRAAMNRQHEDEPANLAALGRQHLSEEARARLKEREDARAAMDRAQPHRYPMQLRIVDPDR